MPNTTIGNDENKYNLSVSTYVKPVEEPPIDIEKINFTITEAVSRSNQLRQEIDGIIAAIGE